MENPIINIITRTSNRPNGFERTVNSIKNQTYKNVNHIVCTDDLNSIEYIIQCGIENYHIIDRDELIKNDNNVDPKTGPYSPHNLYFNVIHEHITDGWVIYLDDDDIFVNNLVLEKLVKLINDSDENHIIFWRMVYSNGMYLPLTIDKSNPPKIGQIGGSCFTFHHKYIKYANWDSWKCGDFRVIDRLYKIIPNYIWYPEKLIYVSKQGFGLRKDI